MTDIRLVIVSLALTLLAALMWIGFLAHAQVAIPDVLQNIAVGSLTALAGVLTGIASVKRRQRA